MVYFPRYTISIPSERRLVSTRSIAKTHWLLKQHSELTKQYPGRNESRRTLWEYCYTSQLGSAASTGLAWTGVSRAPESRVKHQTSNHIEIHFSPLHLVIQNASSKYPHPSPYFHKAPRTLLHSSTKKISFIKAFQLQAFKNLALGSTKLPHLQATLLHNYKYISNEYIENSSYATQSPSFSSSFPSSSFFPSSFDFVEQEFQ